MEFFSNRIGVDAVERILISLPDFRVGREKREKKRAAKKKKEGLNCQAYVYEHHPIFWCARGRQKNEKRKKKYANKREGR